MSQKLSYRIDSALKNEYDEFIIEEFGFKKNRCGSELEKAMKLYMTMKGNGKYANDPEVQAILKKTNKTFKSSQKNTKETSIDEKINQLIEIVEKQQKTINKLEKQTKRESSKKHGHAEFKKQFQMAFNEHHQVSRKDLEHFIMNHADIVDKRAIKSRIQYLLSHGMIESFAPDVYNIKIL